MRAHERKSTRVRRDVAVPGGRPTREEAEKITEQVLQAALSLFTERLLS